MDKEKLMMVLGTISVLIVPTVCGVALVRFGTSVNEIEVNDPKVAPPIVTLAEFEQVETSMRYQEVIGVIGDPGIAITPSATAEGTDGNGETSMYIWKNDDASYMKATFRDDQLLTKSQLFLEWLPPGRLGEPVRK